MPTRVVSQCEGVGVVLRRTPVHLPLKPINLDAGRSGAWTHMPGRISHAGLAARFPVVWIYSTVYVLTSERGYITLGLRHVPRGTL